MPTHQFTPILGKRIRVTDLDICGNPVNGEDSAIATDGFVSVNLSSEVEEGEEIIQRKASGALCVNEKMADSFKRFTMEMEFCGVNPHLISKVTNAQVYEDWQQDPAGFTVPEGEFTSRFAFELWTGLSGQACTPGGTEEEPSGYLLLPFVASGVLGDIEVNGEDAITFSLTGAYTIGGNAWGVGPYDVLFNTESEPAPLPTALDPFDHLLLVDTALAPPPSSNEPVAVPAGV